MSSAPSRRTQPLKDADSAGLLAVCNVTKSFRQGNAPVEALRDVSLSIAAGEFLSVMGPSGCGKSTLLHVIAGLTLPDSGRVLIEGQDLAALSDRALTQFRRRRLGLVFQAFNLIPTLTAEENIMLPLLAAGDSRRIQGQLEPLLERLHIAHRRRHRPDALSGGEQQRVAIARALISDPAIVLADEPTGSLDSGSGQDLCQLLAELCRECQRTMIVVTHEPAVAAWAQRVVVMKDGRITAGFTPTVAGDAQQLAARYQQALSGGGRGDE